MSKAAVGRLTGLFGIRGELKCRPTPLGTNAFEPGKTFALGSLPEARHVRCTSTRRHHERLLLAFEGYATPEAARDLVGAELFADVDPAELAADEYLDADLIGLRLIASDGRELARVVAVRHLPAQDCLVVEPGGALVPLVKAFVAAIDLGAGTISVTLPEGLLEG
jgi:16S rRNA processing protein RimM